MKLSGKTKKVCLWVFSESDIREDALMTCRDKEKSTVEPSQIILWQNSTDFNKGQTIWAHVYAVTEI